MYYYNINLLPVTTINIDNSKINDYEITIVWHDVQQNNWN